MSQARGSRRAHLLGARILGARVLGARVLGAGALLAPCLAWAAPLRWAEGLRHDRAYVKAEVPPPGARPVGLRWWIVDDPDVARLAGRWLDEGRVERAYLPSLPAPPPSALTPDLVEEQYWRDADIGIGADELGRWMGGGGAGIAVVDLEYGWTATHEDLASTVGALAWGGGDNAYAFHGTSVLGQLVAADNGLGVVGVVPGATPLVVSPFDEAGDYVLASAVLAAGELLGPGDVLLIEQQAYCPDGQGYCPVEVEDAVFDAIRAVVDAGVVVVEPAANGARNLDEAVFEGRFDRNVRDSGAILVGGGASPLSGVTPRRWYPFGSCYGSRVDVQGWFDSIATATNGDYNGAYADLYWTGDGDRAYTGSFGGTSGASPMVAGVALAAQAVAWERWGRPWEPDALRSALVATGLPQPPEDAAHIGPLPSLRALLRTWFR